MHLVNFTRASIISGCMSQSFEKVCLRDLDCAPSRCSSSRIPAPPSKICPASSFIWCKHNVNSSSKFLWTSRNAFAFTYALRRCSFNCNISDIAGLASCKSRNFSHICSRSCDHIWLTRICSMHLVNSTRASIISGCMSQSFELFLWTPRVGTWTIIDDKVKGSLYVPAHGFQGRKKRTRIPLQCLPYI